MSLRVKQSQVQTQRLTPQQIIQANIMQLNNMLLEQRIISELEKNPTLEIVEDESSQDESNDEENKEKDESEESDFDWEELDSDSDRFELRRSSDSNSADFLLTNHYEPKTLIDKIKEQLIDINISEDQMNVANEIIGNLDDDGYFKIEPILIADRLNKTEEEVLAILKIIQTLEPRGLASRDLQECMLIQIDKDQSPLAFKVIDECFSYFSKKKYEHICEKLNCGMDELKDCIEYIKRANPKPGDGLSVGEKEFIIPDIILEKRENKWIIHMNDSSMYELRVSGEYSKMLAEKKLDKTTSKFIREKLNSANFFIEAIKQRKKTMMRVMEAIVKKQKNIFQNEKHELIPMVLKDIAENLDLDISTISRSTNGKYVQLPWGIFELKDFFSESIHTTSGKEVSNTIVKNKIKDIIDKEDKAKPLDDQDITDILVEAGYVIARRTISKYRSIMGIPKSKLRREIV